MSIMEVKNVGYTYDNRRKVLRGINVQMEQGKLYAILGPSGCGKTTLLSLIGGLDSPTSGQILFEDQDIAKTGLSDHRKNHVSFIFQAYNLIDYLTLAENVALTSKLPPLPILERLGLTKEEAKRNVLKLSGGQQQRVAIARALMTNPELLLLDEITSALDPMLVGEVLDMVSELKEQGTTILMATHEMSFAHDAADRIVLLRRGVIAENGTPREVMDESRNPETREFFSHFRS